MFINITDNKQADNKAGSGGLVNYLEKENRIHNKEPEYWFNGNQTNIEPYEVRRKIDGNIAKLGRDDAKFFLINISPSQKEIVFLKQCYGENGAKDQMKVFAARVMDAYAQNFKRPGIESHLNLIWFGKLENYRYYSHNDSEVKQGIRKRGDRKPGDQMHVQVIVSRKDATNKIKLSPQNTSRGKNAEHSKKMGQFDRVAFKQSGESLFDDLFGFDRHLNETMAYSNTLKNGTLKERIEMKVQEEQLESVATEIKEVTTGMKTLPEPYQSHTDFVQNEDSYVFSVDIDIKDDIDDEAINGRNRHRKKQARTNIR
ncbi:DUF5712 family protein [Pedobacter endophyticus]|uniref:Molybdopterin-guanine dinucleotide biosynthesis protein MobB n=1 Tax=Pedobacter endophyticus TaxID=2789740 RepID=A0A7U3Q561_9SPHI|nr:DUF5712 family protein [Pedobacter endophyticus]QPH37880.1 molybdopterin-guanine dinucleotide biosynthesis protein MobB [Pedobacter endophyticus]